MNVQKISKGDNVTIVMKPAILREWNVAGETKNSYKLDKRRGSKYEKYKYSGIIYVSKKQVLTIIKNSVVK